MSMGSGEGRNHIPGIDGLRAVSILAVLIFHMGARPILKGAFTGVDVFFVISGYVISASLAGETARGLGAYLLGFYRRRLVRIAPALLTMLASVTAASVLFIPASWLSGAIEGAGASAVLGCSNFFFAFGGDGYFSPRLELNPFLTTWSLAVEEQFYLAFPLVFFFKARGEAMRGARGARTILGFAARHGLGALACASFAASIVQSATSAKLAYYLLPSRFWELALGALLRRQHERGRLVPAGLARPGILVAVGLAAIGAGFLAADPTAFPFPWALPATLGAAAAICGVVGGGRAASPLVAILSSPAMTRLGKISYPLYLWHWPIAALLRWTVGFDSALSKAAYVLASLVLASLSYRFVETPIRRSAFVARQGSSRVVPAALAAAGMAFLAARGLWAARSELSLSATRDAFTWLSGRYAADGPARPIVDDPRVKGRKLFAIGDSHAAAYRTMLDIVSKELGVEVFEYEEGDCPVAGLLRPMDERTRAHYETALRDVRRLARPGDVVFLPGLRMPTFADNFEAADVDAIAAAYLGDEAKRDRRTALEEARAAVAAFEATGARVVLEAPLPVLLAPPYRCSDWFNRMNPVGANGLTVSRAFLEELRAPILESIRDLAAGDERLLVWDPFPVLCRREVFSAYDEGGRPIFWDGDHLSGNGNRILEPSFRDFLVSLWTGASAP
jgi:peptidoglycan/LPS O-acetylase OafA/YrhL